MAVSYDIATSSVRFAISPLGEVGLSLRTLRAPDRFPLQRAWLARTTPLLAGIDAAVLIALVTPGEHGRRYFTPDFLTPAPVQPRPRIEDQLAVLADLTPGELRRQLIASHGRVPDGLAPVGRGTVRRITAALTEYWEACLAPDWPRMRTVLEADVAHRSRVMAERGVGAMLPGISPRVAVHGSLLEVRLHAPIPRTEPVGPEGLVLTPTLFTKDVSVPVLPGLGPHLMYAARGQGAMWAAPAAPTSAALTALLGAGRARILTLLDAPTSTTALAARLDVTPSAVNQHLQVLARAGLLSSARHGRHVLYLRSRAGELLIRGE